MSYNVLLSDAVSDYLNKQDRSRQKAILKHLYEMRNDPFKGDVYLELMGDRRYVYELAKRLERN